MTRMTKIQSSILQRIGNSPLVELKTLGPKESARIFLKLESENPTGSMKDRMALAMIEAAEKDGRLIKGQTVIEYTGGSTGVSLAMICTVKGYPLHIVTSDAFSEEKRNHMKALGAKLTIVPSNDGGMDEVLTLNMIEAARRICEETGGFWTDQLNNTDQLEAYWNMGAEIWRQTGGKVDAFVQSTGTAASVRGVAEYLKGKNDNIHITAIEPFESAVLSGRSTGTHKIEGIGAGFVVPLWNEDHIDTIAMVSTEEAMDMTRTLAQKEGIFAGTSTGANVFTALKLAKTLGPNANIVTLMCDSGIKYLSTQLYKND